MSYDVEIQDKEGVTLSVPKHSEGGTLVVGGTSEACLNITYNYTRLFIEAGLIGGLSAIDQKTCAESIELLEKAIDYLGVIRDQDYWKATKGNAGYALSILLAWA